MRLNETPAGIAILAGAIVLSAACVREAPDEMALTHAEYAENLERADLAGTQLGAAWLDAAQSALSAPATAGLPHHESGAFFPHEARASAIALNAVEGQVLRVYLDLKPESTGRIFLDVFRAAADGESSEALFEARNEDAVELSLERSGRYVVRIQPELLSTVVYELRIELDATLSFPVEGVDLNSVQSFFGDSRDAGRRQHEGIDIFAPRLTPVLAVGEGMATARTNRLGGNTVWLNTDGARYYYAHLEKAAFSGRQRVSAGDVLGYVGNTGNARTTPPHLHFGMYRSIRGAEDPLPYLQSHRLSETLSNTFVPGFIETTASALNLRAAPRMASRNVRMQLKAKTIARALARSGAWVRIRTLEGDEGWIHEDYQRALTRPVDTFMTTQPTWIFGNHGLARRTPVGIAETGRLLHVFARNEDRILVGQSEDVPLGWLLPEI